MAQDLFLAPIEALKFADIIDLVTAGAEEGIRLEFKESLPTNDGRPDRWMRDQSGIGRVARDDIAREVVAFANAYGGVIIVGIVETDDHPKRARQLTDPQIPRVADCADQLARALRSIIDPPLPMLEVRGIPSSGANGDGAIIIRIGSSPSAPHGFGMPPATYVRHGSEAAPLSMRELQSMFFERRTRLERIESRRSDFSTIAKDLWSRRSNGRLRKPSGETFAPTFPAFLFRCSLVPADDFAIDNFPDRFFSLKDRRAPKPEMGRAPAELIELPQFASQWLRRYRAVEHIGNAGDRRYWCASIEADGSISQISIVAAVTSGLQQIAPAWHARVILQGMVLAEWLRRWAARPDVEYTLDAEFINGGAYIVTNADYDEQAVVAWPNASIGPYAIGRRSTFSDIFDVIERELWDVFGVPRQSPLKFDLEEVFRSIET
jgi:hypothetical protein